MTGQTGVDRSRGARAPPRTFTGAMNQVSPDQPPHADKPTDGRGKFGLIAIVVGTIAVLAVILAVVVGLVR